MTQILLLAEARGEAEHRHGSTLIGASGMELLRMMDRAGMITLTDRDLSFMRSFYSTSDNRYIMRIWDNHPDVHRTNVFNLHPPQNDLSHFLGPKALALRGYPTLKVPKIRRDRPAPGGSFVRAEFAGELERLGDELLAHDPNLIVCLGNVAMWAMLGQAGVSKLRGTTLNSTLTVSGYKLLPTYHPAAVLRNWDLRPVVIADLSKAKRESAYAEIRRPQREIWIGPSLEDIRTFIRTHVDGCELLSVDIETSGTRITCIGLAPSASLAIVIPFDDERTKTGSYFNSVHDEREAWQLVSGVLTSRTPPKLFQNGAYDISFLWRSMRIKVMGASEDTMLLHHALHPESLKSLGFLGSLYSDEGAWKADYRRKIKEKTIKRDA